MNRGVMRAAIVASTIALLAGTSCVKLIRSGREIPKEAAMVIEMDPSFDTYRYKGDQAFDEEFHRYCKTLWDMRDDYGARAISLATIDTSFHEKILLGYFHGWMAQEDPHGHKIMKNGNELTDVEKQTVFNPMWIIKFFENGIDPGYVTHLVYEAEKHGVPYPTPGEVFRLFGAQIHPEEAYPFKDTDRPNAVLTYPREEYGFPFIKPQIVRNLAMLTKTYDCAIRTIETEEELYTLLDSIPDISLIVTHGHGSRALLGFGIRSTGPDIHLASIDERLFLSPEDTEVGDHIQNILEDAIFHLYGCYTGEGKHDDENMVNFVAGIIPGRKVIGFTDNSYVDQIYIVSLLPYDVCNLTSLNKGISDATYRTIVPRTGTNETR
ncbi:MAG: hypothetical protein ABIH34_00680 [Nanoarchaeota archaeon]